MNLQRRALGYLVAALYFGAALLASYAHESQALTAVSAVAMGGSLTLAIVSWEYGKHAVTERKRRRPAGLRQRRRVAIAGAGLGLVAILGSASRAGGQTPATPVASRTVYAHGRFTCQATAAPGGWYLAAHCLGFGVPMLGDGVARRFAADPGGRDIAHIVDPTVTTATLGTAAVGEVLAWHNVRTTGMARFVRATTGYTKRGSWYPDAPGQPLWVLCLTSGTRFHRGDSGTGLSNERGELAALFVGGELDDDWPPSPDCAAAQRIFAVPVP